MAMAANTTKVASSAPRAGAACRRPRLWVQVTCATRNRHQASGIRPHGEPQGSGRVRLVPARRRRTPRGRCSGDRFGDNPSGVAQSPDSSPMCSDVAGIGTRREARRTCREKRGDDRLRSPRARSNRCCRPAARPAATTRRDAFEQLELRRGEARAESAAGAASGCPDRGGPCQARARRVDQHAIEAPSRNGSGPCVGDVHDAHDGTPAARKGLRQQRASGAARTSVATTRPAAPRPARPARRSCRRVRRRRRARVAGAAADQLRDDLRRFVLDDAGAVAKRVRRQARCPRPRQPVRRDRRRRRFARLRRAVARRAPRDRRGAGWPPASMRRRLIVERQPRLGDRPRRSVDPALDQPLRMRMHDRQMLDECLPVIVGVARRTRGPRQRARVRAPAGEARR